MWISTFQLSTIYFIQDICHKTINNPKQVLCRRSHHDRLFTMDILFTGQHSCKTECLCQAKLKSNAESVSCHSAVCSGLNRPQKRQRCEIYIPPEQRTWTKGQVNLWYDVIKRNMMATMLWFQRLNSKHICNPWTQRVVLVLLVLATLNLGSAKLWLNMLIQKLLALYATTIHLGVLVQEAF